MVALFEHLLWQAGVSAAWNQDQRLWGWGHGLADVLVDRGKTLVPVERLGVSVN